MAALNAAPHPLEVERRCALVRTLWAHVQARDWTAMRAAFADDAVLEWPCSTERFVGADTIVGVNAAYPEGWTLQVNTVDAVAVLPEADYRRDAGLFFKSIHGTHHRGQITAALTALGQPCPELDLVWMLQAQSENS